ncbi:peroxiredoxin-like [Osmia lignaria lignaria]|uniref:peroxiredoxin-like n=1 Tax=Osmia lignaria lignaria TaxID=1437193 RepID=UPI0014788F1E|nr:peroxiredoxin-2-like [Osmia lignaria]
MSTFDHLFGRKMLEHENLCCGEQPQKSQEPQEKPEVHVVPALSNTAPAWSGAAIINFKIQNISSRDFLGKYLIMLFYPYDFTFFCPTEMIQFSDRVDEFLEAGCDLVAISTDSQYSHLSWIITPRKQGGLGEMKMAVLSDKNHKISREYGVLDEKEGIALKGLFIIDKKQIIRYISLSEITLSRSVDETLRILQACQFVDKFGGTCPAGPREPLLCAEKDPNYFTAT